MSTAEENPVTTPVDETEVDAEAERLFAEAAEAREGKPADEPAPADVGTAAPTQDDEVVAGAGEGEGGSPAEAEPAKKDGAVVETPAPGSGEFDWSTAEPAAKAAFEAAAQQFEHKLRSANGRVSVLDRKLQELRKEGGPGEEEDQPRKPLKELLESAELKEVAEEYPDLKAVLETVRAVAERVDGVEQTVGQVSKSVVANATSAEERALDGLAGNWRDLAKHEEFLGWVDDQPKKTRDAIASNWDGITNAAAAAEAFKAFEAHIKPPEKDEGQGGEPTPSKRERQAQGAKGAKVNAPTSAGGESDDPDVLFAQAAAKKDRERGLRT